MRKNLKVVLVLAPLVWIGLLAWASQVIPLHDEYYSLWREHRQMMANNQARSASGQSLSDVFEAMSMAGRYYLSVLEGVIEFGVLPAFVIYFSLALRQALRSPPEPVIVESGNTDGRSSIRLMAKRLFLAASIVAWSLIIFTLSFLMVALNPDDAAQGALIAIGFSTLIAKVFIAWAIGGLVFAVAMFMTRPRSVLPG